MPVVARGSIQITVGGAFKGRRQRAIVQAIERGLLAAGRKYLRKVKQLTPVGATGNLKNSYQIQFISRPRRGVRVTSFLNYAQIMEFGRRPGSRWPPSGPIRAWVQVRAPAIVQRWGLEGATFLVRRAIGRKGIRVTRASGLRHNPGKGAMFRRATDQLGSGFVTSLIAREVGLISGGLR